LSVTAVIPAAGIGKRFGGDVKKQFYQVLDQTVMYYTLTALNRAYPFEEFILGGNPDDFPYLEEQLNRCGISNYKLVRGGAERYETVYNCLKEATGSHVLIHDAVRPFVQERIIQETIQAGIANGAAICGVKVRDTLKKVGNDSVEKTVNRDEFILSHTPQVFERTTLIRAVENLDDSDVVVTDEAQAMEIFGREVHWVESSPDNIKITFLDDMETAESLVRKYFQH
jgi:2-C-methyl-D-erythritol 4-phosphate cytidylyltransferase